MALQLCCGSILTARLFEIRMFRTTILHFVWPGQWPGSSAVSLPYTACALSRSRFALLFLVFTIPLPMFLLEGIVTALQLASAEASDIVFRLTGASYHRSGLVFEFPNVAVELAEECSGIRSSLSLFILSIITGYLFLRTFSRRVILALAIFPITVVKNGFRIVTITLLANYVDMRFLTNHWIHSSGRDSVFCGGDGHVHSRGLGASETEIPGTEPAGKGMIVPNVR